MACRTGCPTPGAHASWGECARSAAIQIDRHGLKHGRQVEIRKDRRLDRYAEARKDGLQPRSTQDRDINAALEEGGVAPTPVTIRGE